MDHNKLITEFRKDIGKLKKEKYTEEDLKVRFNMIKDGIIKDVKNGDAANAASNLTLSIGVHAGAYPKHLILNGDKTGWRFITRYLLWQEHILIKLFNRTEVSARTIGGIMALATLWKMENLATLSRKYFDLLFEKNKEKYSKKETHHLFVAILVDLVNKKPINDELFAVLPADNIYKRLLSNWNTTDSKKITELLFETCDFDIYSTLDLKNKLTEILGLDLIPYDIRLLEYLRSNNKLETPIIEHPLMQTQLAEIPSQKYEWDIQSDEVFQFLLEREK